MYGTIRSVVALFGCVFLLDKRKTLPTAGDRRGQVYPVVVTSVVAHLLPASLRFDLKLVDTFSFPARHVRGSALNLATFSTSLHCSYAQSDARRRGEKMLNCYRDKNEGTYRGGEG